MNCFDGSNLTGPEIEMTTGYGLAGYVFAGMAFFEAWVGIVGGCQRDNGYRICVPMTRY